MSGNQMIGEEGNQGKYYNEYSGSADEIHEVGVKSKFRIGDSIPPYEYDRETPEDDCIDFIPHDTYYYSRVGDDYYYYSGSGNYEQFINMTDCSNSTQSIVKICGYPGFFDGKKCKDLDEGVVLQGCEVPGAAVAYVFSIILLGLVIVAGNSLLPIAVIYNKKMRTRLNYIKVSLSFADMLLGWILLFRVFPNIVWVRNATTTQLTQYVVDSKNTAEAIIVGSLVTVANQASSLHLLYLSQDRFRAICFPFTHRALRRRTVIYTSLLLWCASLFCAFIPAFLEKHFSYQFQSVWLVHALTVNRNPDHALGLAGSLYLIFTWVLPYLVTVILTILTAISAWKSLRANTMRKINMNERISSYRHQPHRRTQLVELFDSLECINLSSTSTSSTKRTTTEHSVENETSHSLSKLRLKLKPEIELLNLIIIMITVYSVTLLPIVIIFLLYYIDVLNCTNYSTAWNVAYFASITNSLANFVIYTSRDAEFRKTWRRLMCKCFRKSSFHH